MGKSESKCEFQGTDVLSSKWHKMICLGDEQMNNEWSFSLLNEEQRIATRWGWFAPTSDRLGLNDVLLKLSLCFHAAVYHSMTKKAEYVWPLSNHFVRKKNSADGRVPYIYISALFEVIRFQNSKRWSSGRMGWYGFAQLLIGDSP